MKQHFILHKLTLQRKDTDFSFSENWPLWLSLLYKIKPQQKVRQKEHSSSLINQHSIFFFVHSQFIALAVDCNCVNILTEKLIYQIVGGTRYNMSKNLIIVKKKRTKEQNFILAQKKRFTMVHDLPHQLTLSSLMVDHVSNWLKFHISSTQDIQLKIYHNQQLEIL